MKNIIEILGQMKELKRSGFIKRQIDKPESIADHSFGVALLVMLLCPEDLDKQKCLEMAIVHDLVETITGDFTPCDNILPETKYENELKAIKELSQKLEKPELVSFFVEFEELKTKESKFVKELDKLEALLQCKYYDANKPTDFYKKNDIGFDCLFDEFYSTATGKISQKFCERLKR